MPRSPPAGPDSRADRLAGSGIAGGTWGGSAAMILLSAGMINGYGIARLTLDRRVAGSSPTRSSRSFLRSGWRAAG